MSEVNHTPGPWQAWNLHNNAPMRRWRVGSRGVTPGIVTPVAMLDNEKTTPEEQVGNAMLIAAAPDLLASLRELVNCADPGRDWAELKRAREAIDKATKF